jgi:hypothetical protein
VRMRRSESYAAMKPDEAQRRDAAADAAAIRG